MRCKISYLHHFNGATVASNAHDAALVTGGVAGGIVQFVGLKVHIVRSTVHPTRLYMKKCMMLWPAVTELTAVNVIDKSLGIDRFTLNRFLPIPILTDFEYFNLTDTDTDFVNWITYRYRYRFYTFYRFLPIPILTDTDFSERSVQYLAQTRSKLKMGVNLACLSIHWITRSVQLSNFSLL